MLLFSNILYIYHRQHVCVYSGSLRSMVHANGEEMAFESNLVQCDASVNNDDVLYFLRNICTANFDISYSKSFIYEKLFVAFIRAAHLVPCYSPRYCWHFHPYGFNNFQFRCRQSWNKIFQCRGCLRIISFKNALWISASHIQLVLLLLFAFMWR